MLGAIAERCGSRASRDGFTGGRRIRVLKRNSRTLTGPQILDLTPGEFQSWNSQDRSRLFMQIKDRLLAFSMQR